MLEAILHPIAYDKQRLTMEKVRSMLAYTILRCYHLFELEMDRYMAATGDTLENYTHAIEKSRMWCDMMMIGMYTHMQYDNYLHSQVKPVPCPYSCI